jgi:hypothetical protein
MDVSMAGPFPAGPSWRDIGVSRAYRQAGHKKIDMMTRGISQMRNLNEGESGFGTWIRRLAGHGASDTDIEPFTRRQGP